MMLLILAAAATIAPDPGELRTFSDWTVGCDNGLACEAIVLLPETAEWSQWVTMSLRRGKDEQHHAGTLWRFDSSREAPISTAAIAASRAGG